MVTVFFCTKWRVGFGVPYFILDVKYSEALTAVSRLLGFVFMQLCNVHTQVYNIESIICFGKYYMFFEAAVAKSFLELILK